MEEKKKEDNMNVNGDSEATNINSETEATPGAVTDGNVNVSASNEVEPNEVAVNHSGKNFNIKAYVGGVLVILVIFAGLIFALEKEGRISTGLFTVLISNLEDGQPAIMVNGEAVTTGEYKSSLGQLSNMRVAQGEDLTDSAVIDSIKNETIDTLINAEILRQAAIKEGLTASADEIDARFNEISENLGGAELLAARMEEFGVTEKALRHDIENEFLIQQLFDLKILNEIEVTDEEVQQMYDQAVAAGNELPPLSEIKETAITEIRDSKSQSLINDYIQTLRADADIEILI